jgi:hypothetical protein
VLLVLTWVGGYLYSNPPRLIKWLNDLYIFLLIDSCLISSKQYINYIHDIIVNDQFMLLKELVP